MGHVIKSNSNLAIQEQRRVLRKAMRLKDEIVARLCEQDLYTWLTKGTKTKDEQAMEGVDSERPFPPLEYIENMCAFLNFPYPLIKPKYIYKSRTMLATWTCCGWSAHRGFNKPNQRIIFQSKDEDKAIHMIDCVKVLWSNSTDELKKKWKVDRLPYDQPYRSFTLSNGTTFIGLVGDADKIRSQHPTIYVHDEASFNPDLIDALTQAMGAKTPYIVVLSSSALGDMNDIYEAMEMIDPVELIQYRDAVRDYRSGLVQKIREQVLREGIAA